jgi:signal transduction histidine kinase
MKSEFVSIVSHELRSPLTSIKGGVSTLRSNWRSIGEDVKFELLDSMANQCDKLARMITQILTVSGIQRGGLGLRESTFSLACIAHDALDALRPQLEGRVVRAAIATDVEATGDRMRVAEVVLALVENALAFTTGPVTIRVEGDAAESRLHVADEGPGLDEATIARLLDNPFTQADSSTTRAVGGLGLSLYIAKQVLAASGGRLEVVTSPDGGSTFTMVLPAPQAASAVAV